MENFKYIYGPIPSRRLGLSVGVSAIPKKFCTYSCVYCQLGRTNHLSLKREEFFPLKDILDEFKKYLESSPKFDVISLVGEGEPTLYLKLKELIIGLKKLTDKPICVITNGSLLSDKDVQDALFEADIVLPSLNAFDEKSFRAINRAHGYLNFETTYKSLVDFSHKYKGELWLEVMLVSHMNDDKASLLKLKELKNKINHSKLYVNTCIRPPAESYIKPSPKENINMACDILNGISIDSFKDGLFYSEIKDDYKAILSIIKRHPMNHHELKSFLQVRNCSNEKIHSLIDTLKNDKNVEVINYKGYYIFRLSSNN